MSDVAGTATLAAETERLRGLRQLVCHELRDIEGVCGVGVGVRETGGVSTGELAFWIYVRCKLPAADVPAGQLIPRRIAGVPTDVHALERFEAECCNAVRPLVAGITISRSPSSQPGQGGTIGCFVKLASGHTAILTNEHVLRVLPPDDTSVFQPRMKRFVTSDCNVIGRTVTDLQFFESFPFNDGTGTKPHFVDCAVAQITEDYRNRSVAIKNDSDAATNRMVTMPANVAGAVTVNKAGQVVEIRDGAGNVVDTTRIRSTAAPVANTLVFKIGGFSGLTAGFVESVDATATIQGRLGPMEIEHQIQIKPLAGYTTDKGTLAFTDDGDSGSVYIDLQNNIIGLHHHGNISELGQRSIGSRIGAVLARLHAILITTDGETTTPTASPSRRLAEELWLESPPAARELDSIADDVRRRLLRTPHGREAVRVVEAHVQEVLDLIRRRRAVTVVWHRHHGPAFVALVARALAGPAGTFPSEVAGIPRQRLLRAMLDVLHREGSAELAADIDRLAPWVVNLVGGARDVDDLVRSVEETAA